MEVANGHQGCKHVIVEVGYVSPSILKHRLKQRFKQHHQLEAAHTIIHGHFILH
jgi:hypothetical protein